LSDGEEPGFEEEPGSFCVRGEKKREPQRHEEHEVVILLVAMLCVANPTGRSASNPAANAGRTQRISHAKSAKKTVLEYTTYVTA
jgi:hypothetical protein